MDSYNTIIIGAGVWGLCAAHTFLTIDPSISLLIVDSKKSIGGVWAKEQIYPGLRANNLQGLYEFSDFPMLEAGLGVRPRGKLSGETLHSYLVKYADHFDLTRRIRLETEVVRAEETDGQSDAAWRVELKGLDGHGPTSFVSCAKLVVCTGQAAVPRLPPFEGLASFTKPVIHTVDLATAGVPLLTDDKIQKITVIGGSKSAHDAVYLYATAGKQVTWLVHAPDKGRGAMPMAKSYTQLGPWSVWLEGLLLVRPLTWFVPAPWSDGDGFGWVRWFLHSTSPGIKLVKGFFANMGGESMRLSGILGDPKTELLLPSESMLWYGTTVACLNYDQDFYSVVREKISVIRGSVGHLADDGVYLDDGQVIETDALICATGYDYSATVPLEPASRRLRWGYPVEIEEDNLYRELDARADKELLARFPILKDSPSKPEREPSLTPWRLWRLLAPPSQVAHGQSRNLLFLNSIACFQTTTKAEITSLWGYAYLHDRLKVQTPEEDEARYQATLWSRFGKWKVPYGMQGKSTDFLYEAMPYYDLLLRDLGLRSWRKGWGWFGEVFGGWYGVQDYHGIVQEWMQAQKTATLRKKKDL